MITLEATYAKKIGLPGYSSHQFSITLKTEITDVTLVQQESTRLYNLLQNGVDNSIRQIGFLPANQNGNGHTNGHSNGNGNGSGHGHTPNNTTRPELWTCSPKQKSLILDIVEENKVPKDEIERLSQDRFSKGVRQLNKLEASGLIDELLARHGRPGAQRARAMGPIGGKR